MYSGPGRRSKSTPSARSETGSGSVGTASISAATCSSRAAGRYRSRMWPASSASSSAIPGPGRPNAYPWPERDAHADERVELLDALDALGDDPRVDARRELAQRLDDRGLRRVVVEVVHERAVDLDEVRVQRGDARERAVAGAGVVDGDERAARAQLGERGAERVEVGVGLLGDLDDHGVEPVVLGERRLHLVASAARAASVHRQEAVGATCGRASSTSRTICASSAPPMPWSSAAAKTSAGGDARPVR